MTITIEVFAVPGCTQCAETRDTLRQVVESFGSARIAWREVNVLEELDYAVEVGVLSPPSLAIDGELVFPKLPTPEKLRDAVNQRLAAQESR